MTQRSRSRPIPVSNLSVDEHRHLLHAFSYNVDVDTPRGAGWTLGCNSTVSYALTDRLVACDPFLVRGARAFRRKITPGVHQVKTYAVHVKGQEQPVVAFASIRHRKARLEGTTIARFELALFEGAADEVTGYPVDYATGCFCSAEAAEGIAGNEREYDRLCRSMEAPMGITKVKSKGGTVGGFSTGLGDGNYRSYWALDASGNVLGLITDFGVVTSDRGRGAATVSGARGPEGREPLLTGAPLTGASQSGSIATGIRSPGASVTL